MSKGTETRNRIIAKAAPLFNRKGYEGRSMQDIVEAVGLEKGTLYGHFPTKEALAVAAFEYAWNETCAARTARMDTVTNAIEKLKIHVDNALSCPSFPGGWPPAEHDYRQYDGNSALKKMAREAFKGWQSYLEGIAKEGQERKEIRPEFDPEDIVAVVISLLEGAMALARLDKKSGLLGRAGRHINSYLDARACQPA